MPDGLAVAWFSCGSCAALDIHLCRCQRGMSPGRSVEYIYDSTVAVMNGEEWTPHHRNYPGSLRAADEGSRSRSGPLPMPTFMPQPKDAPGSTQTGARSKSGASVPTLDQINAAASTDASSAMADAMAAVNATTAVDASGDPVWKFDPTDWESNRFGVFIPDDYDPDDVPKTNGKKRKLTRRK